MTQKKLQKKLIIPHSIYNDIISHAKSELPNESCGYLAGKALAGKDATLSKFYPMTNVDASPEHFSFDPKEQFAVVKDARNNKLELLSVYHSHPETPARLSEEDIRLFNDPNPVYIIVSLKDKTPEINGFTVNKPTENEIEIEKITLEIN
jgi:proteasome lid subunit RPN8/RPN11